MAATAEEDNTRMVLGLSSSMVPARGPVRRRTMEFIKPPKKAAEKREELWSLGPGFGEGRLGREGVLQRNLDWEAAKFPNLSPMGRDVRRHQRQSIQWQTNNPLKIRQQPKGPSLAGKRLPAHLKTTKRCPTPDGMVGRTTRMLRAVGSSSIGMTADQMERRRQGQKELLAIRERRRNPGLFWERDPTPDESANRSHGVARATVATRAMMFGLGAAVDAAVELSPTPLQPVEARGGRMSTDW